MPNGVRFIGGLWYVDGDDAAGRQQAGLSWRKLMVRLSGTHAPYLEAALVNLRGWWQQWHGQVAYQADVAADEFEKEILKTYDLQALGWERKGFDSWHAGEFKDGLVLVDDYNKIFVRKMLDSTDDLQKLASFLDGIEPRHWLFLPEDMTMWVAWDGAGGGDQVLDHLGTGAQGMKEWAVCKKRRVWKQFLDKVCEKAGGGCFNLESGQTPRWVRDWCDRRNLSEESPCTALLRDLRAENTRRKLWKRVVVALGGLLFLGAVIFLPVKYAQESKAFKRAQALSARTGDEELEQLVALESDLKAGGGGMFIGKQWKSLQYEVMNRVDEAIERQMKSIAKLQKRGDYMGAAQVCARIGACLSARGEEGSECEKKASKLREQEQELEKHLAHTEELLETQNYARAREGLQKLENMVEAADESRQARLKKMWERVNLEPSLVIRWERLKKQASAGRSLDDWRLAAKGLDELEAEIGAHPAVIRPEMVELEVLRGVLGERLGKWEQVNKLYDENLGQWQKASPASKTILRAVTVRNLKSCLSTLDGIYNENGGQPCGGPEMEALYSKINQALGKLQSQMEEGH